MIYNVICELRLSLCQSILDNDSKLHDVWRKLTSEDSVVAWMCLVHLKAFKCLPGQLYDPSGNSSDVIVNKVNLHYLVQL